MNKFEKFILQNGIQIGEVATPFERLLLRMGVISMPVGLLSYPKRALWFSIVFTVLFIGCVELALQIIVGISFFTAVPPQDILLGISVLLLFGPMAAYFSHKSIEKYREKLETFIREQ